VPNLAQLECREALVELGHHARRQPPGGKLLGQDELVVEGAGLGDQRLVVGLVAGELSQVPFYPLYALVDLVGSELALDARLRDPVLLDEREQGVEGLGDSDVVLDLGWGRLVFGQTFADQTEIQIRNHALESACFVVNATGWLSDEQIAKIAGETGADGAIRGGSITAIIDPEGRHVVPPLTFGEGILVADLDLEMNLQRKRLMDSVGHFSRPELLRLLMNTPATSATVTREDLIRERLGTSASNETIGADTVVQLIEA